MTQTQLILILKNQVNMNDVVLNIKKEVSNKNR